MIDESTPIRHKRQYPVHALAELDPLLHQMNYFIHVFTVPKKMISAHDAVVVDKSGTDGVGGGKILLSAEVRVLC